MKKYRITLTDQEKEELQKIIRKGNKNATVFRNAYILLKADESIDNKGKTDEEISDFLEITVQTVENIRKKFVLEGFEIALHGRPSNQVRIKKIDGDVEAHLVALACEEPPKGFAKWSLRMLANKMVELNYVDSMSHETVRNTLKKMNYNHGK